MVSNTPAVSIVIPTYNVEKYIRQCMESVITQTLEDIEIICIDDGSTDKSGKILDEYASKDKRIRVVHKENTGYGHSMNLGISLAHGKYIGIVEPDDFIKPNMYRVLYETAEKYKVDFVKSDFFNVYGTNLIYIPLTSDESLLNKVIIPSENLEIFKMWMYNWSGIYNRNFLISNNIRHNETPGASYQDLGFYFQIFTLAKTCYFLNEPYYCYRMDNTNSSFRNPSKMYIAQKEQCFIKEFLNKNNNISQNFIQAYYFRIYEFFIFTYYRLDKKLKKEFLKIFAEEFSKPFNNGEIDKEYLGEKNYKNLYLIINDPEKFWRKTMHINSFLENVISFKNINNHKVVTLLGVKFKVRKK